MTERRSRLTGSGGPFTTGSSEYFDAYPGIQEGNARIYVQFQPQGAPFEFLALLDTGAHYCILNEEAAGLTQSYLTSSLGQVDIRTAYGLVRGPLYSHRIRLIAEVGDPLDIETMVFVPPDWQAPCFIGYTGVLDRIRFAIDSPKNQFFFGPPD